MSVAGGLKSSQMVYFPAERSVAARLMLLVFSELKSLRRCVLFQLVQLIACVYVSACMSARVKENNCAF